MTFECCGKTFSDRCNFSRHQKLHGEEINVFKCPADDCDYSAKIQFANLLGHIKIGCESKNATVKAAHRALATSQPDIFYANYLVKHAKGDELVLGARMRFKAQVLVQMTTSTYNCYAPSCRSVEGSPELFNSYSGFSSHIRSLHQEGLYKRIEVFLCPKSGCLTIGKKKFDLLRHAFSEHSESFTESDFKSASRYKSMNGEIVSHTDKKIICCAGCSLFVDEELWENHREIHKVVEIVNILPSPAAQSVQSFAEINPEISETHSEEEDQEQHQSIHHADSSRSFGNPPSEYAVNEEEVHLSLEFEPEPAVIKEIDFDLNEIEAEDAHSVSEDSLRPLSQDFQEFESYGPGKRRRLKE